MTEQELIAAENWQTPTRGDNRAEFEIYRACADNGSGLDITTGLPLKTFEEWRLNA